MELERAIWILRQEIKSSRMTTKYFDNHNIDSPEIRTEKMMAEALETVLNEVERKKEISG